MFLLTFPISRGLKTRCAGICFISLAGKAISKAKDKRRHDVKLKSLSYLWYKAGIRQRRHTGPIQPSSRLGRWYFWVHCPCSVGGGETNVDIPLHRASNAPLICRSRSRKQHPGLLPLLQSSLNLPLHQEPLKEGLPCVTPCAPGKILLLALIHGHQSFTTKSYQIAWFTQMFRKGLEVVTRCAGSCHGTIA